MYCNTFISSGLKGKYGGIIILGGMGGNDDLTGRPYAGGKNTGGIRGGIGPLCGDAGYVGVIFDGVHISTLGTNSVASGFKPYIFFSSIASRWDLSCS